MKKWKMPNWMKQYEDMIIDTGGNPIEELVNDHETTAQVNIVRAMLCVAVKDQVALLTDLHNKGLLKDRKEKT